ncbi:hypothetical protein AAVH_16002 [Aphelenchoides avenae]|nr:hypothetical protein AAVH_16002 [Aphelenchus avenae]
MRRELIADAENREDALRSEIREKERELESANNTISDLRDKNADLESERATLNNRVHCLEAEVDERDDVARQWKEHAETLEQECDASKQENEQLRDKVDDLGNELEECGEDLRDKEEARQSLEAALIHAKGKYEQLEEEHEATIEELGNTRERMEVLEEREGRLLARVYAQELQDIGISAADTVYIEDPDKVVARVTKANLIKGFDLHMVGRKRTNKPVRELSARAAAEYANTMNIKPQCRGEMLDVFFSRAMDTFEKRAVVGVKRRRMEERLTYVAQ